MSKHRQLIYGQALPQDFLDALQEYISTAAPNLNLTLTGVNTIQVIAGTGSAQVACGINGLWRYISTTISANVTGAPGTYDVFATTGANAFQVNSTPPPAEIDNTDYTFALAVVAHGSTPAGATNYRKLGEVVYDGTRITSLRQMIGNLDGSTLWQSGDVKMSAVQNPPAGWLLCNGQAVSRATYAALYAALGGNTSPWGQGDGSTTFNVPDLRGRAPIGAGQGGGLTNRIAGTYGGGVLDTNSVKLGEERHLLSNGEMPTHAHSGTTGTDSPDHAHNVNGSTGNDSPDHAHNVQGGTSGQNTNHTHNLSLGGRNYVVTDGGSNAFSAAGYPQTVVGGHTAVMFSNAATSEGNTNWADRDHSHTFNVNSGGAGARHAHGVNIGSGGASARHAHAVANDGGGGDHNNMPPWIAISYVIKT